MLPLLGQSIDDLPADSSSILVLHPDQNRLQKYLDDPDFQYEEAPKTAAPSNWFWDWIDEKLKEIFPPGSGKYLEWVWRIFWIGILVFGIVQLLKLNPTFFIRNQKQGEQPTFTEIEENIHEADLIGLLADALSRQDYRRAVRLQYLAALKKLSEESLIKWRVDKINQIYVDEVPVFLRSSFAHLTRLYEKVWYGEMDIDAYIYGLISTEFNQFLETITKRPAA